MPGWTLRARTRNVYCSHARGEDTALKTFILGLVLGLLVVPVALYAYFFTGTAPAATSAPPMPFEKMLAHKALNARIAKEMPTSVPVPADESNELAGARLYNENCAVCHGATSGAQSAIARGMYPKPPMLLQGKGVTDDEAGETYWKVANGIRLTGMPGFRQSLGDTQMWQISVLLANADKLPDSVKQALAGPQAPPPGAARTLPPPPANTMPPIKP